MPDITLYQDDVESLRGICLVLRNNMRKAGTGRILSDEGYKLIAECDRLIDLLVDRLAQGLHPKRE